MAKYPAINFYPKDWLTDHAVRSCPAFARGIWIDMLMLMHECEPYGYLTMPDGQPMPLRVLARRLGEQKDLVGKALGHLSKSGAFSTDSEGKIYSRRMVKDSERSATGKKYAEKRWNRGKQPEIISSPNGDANGQGNGKPTPKPNGTPNAPFPFPLEEEEVSLEKSSSSSSKNAARVARAEPARSLRYQAPKRPPPTFDEFWTAYPSNPETDDREAGEIWWSDASDLDRWFAISEIPVLLAWINEAPSDPERKIWRAHDWLSGKFWMEVWRRRPDLKPSARAERGEQLAIDIVEVAV